MPKDPNMPFAQFPTNVTSCRTVVQYHSQGIDVNTIHRS